MPYRNRVERIFIFLDSHFREICCEHYDWPIVTDRGTSLWYEMMRVDTS